MKQFFQHIIAEYPISFESLIIWVKLILCIISYIGVQLGSKSF